MQTHSHTTNNNARHRRIAHHEDVLHPKPVTALPSMASSTIDDQSEATLDAMMQQHLRAHDVTSGALAIAKHGRLIYGKAFGWHDSSRSAPVREDFISRIASVSKPLVAGAIRQLIARGDISLESAAFDVLQIAPFGGELSDRRWRDIKIKHLLAHRGGWANDYTFAEGRCAQELGVQHPASRHDVAQWIMSKPLQYDPGTQKRYSNVGYLMLGLIVEKVSGLSFEKAIQRLVFAPLGVQSDRVVVGDNHPSNAREWDYEGWRAGMWDMEGHCAQGGIVTEPAALLTFTSQYYCGLGEHIGVARPADGIWKCGHQGSHPGASSVLHQRGDGVDVCLIFNKMNRAGSKLRHRLDQMLDSGELPWGEDLSLADFEGM